MVKEKGKRKEYRTGMEKGKANENGQKGKGGK